MEFCETDQIFEQMRFFVGQQPRSRRGIQRLEQTTEQEGFPDQFPVVTLGQFLYFFAGKVAVRTDEIEKELNGMTHVALKVRELMRGVKI